MKKGNFTCREWRGIALDWGSARLEKDFWSIGRAPVEAAKASASRCSFGTLCSVEVEAPILADAGLLHPVSSIF